MSGIWAIIPIKRLQRSKSRLSQLLSSQERAQLMRGLLAHVLTVVADVPHIQKTLVITPDPEAMQIASQYPKVLVIQEVQQGLNPAVTQAVQQAEQAGATGILILPADLPFVQVKDLVAVITAVDHTTPTMVICTDNQQDGTNALLLSPPQPFTFHYGRNSFSQHLTEAKRCGYQSHSLQLAGLMFDLDTEADWQRYRNQSPKILR